MRTQPISLRQLNALDQVYFIAALDSLFEGPPWIVTQTWHTRPFSDISQLHQALCDTLDHAPLAAQVALIQAHPDLVGRAALAGTLTPSSTNEQASAGLDHLSQDEIATFTRLNQRYAERFGFPFVICARENKKESILAGFASRLDNPREREIEIALGEIARICWYRLIDTVQA